MNTEEIIVAEPFYGGTAIRHYGYDSSTWPPEGLNSISDLWGREAVSRPRWGNI